MNNATYVEEPDVVLIGTGIMSANLGALLKRLDPSLRIQVYEVSSDLTQEASDGWNNAGTGHAGICELSYTPDQDSDGTVDVGKAIEIFQQFEHSKQFWRCCSLLRGRALKQSVSAFLTSANSELASKSSALLMRPSY